MGEIPASLDDAAKAEATRKRMRFLLQLAVAARERTGSFAGDRDALARDSGRLGEFVARSCDDGWGRPLAFAIIEIPAAGGKPAAQLLRLASPGSDGLEGGEGPAADLVLESDPVPIDRTARKDGGANLQARLAKALGLAYQLDHVDSGKPNWRNSDMDVEQVRTRLEQAGPNATMILRLLDGNSIEGRVAGILVSFLGASRTLSGVAKLMLVEQLARADASLDAMSGMEAMRKVIIDDRNRVVLDDLRKVLADEPGRKSIAIFYGAGHLPAFERSFREELGLEPAGETWTAAMTVDPRELGMSEAQVRQMQRMLDRSLRRAPAN